MGYAVDAITRQLDMCLEEDLLFGRGDNWPAITHPIHDDMTEVSAGHSFLGNPENVHLQQSGSSLAEMVARTPGLRSRFLQDGALDIKELKKCCTTGLSSTFPRTIGCAELDRSGWESR